MRHFAAALLALCVCLLPACARLAGAAPPPPVQPEDAPSAPPPVEPDYQVDASTVENTFAAEDGTEVARYAYTLLTLSVVNGEELSAEEAEAAERNMDAFNEIMTALMEKSAETGRLMGEDALSRYTSRDRNGLSYYDETSASAVLRGQVISVRLENSSYTGGAHPNWYVSGLLFDLRTGQFINPIQVADTPEAFRTGAAEVLLEKLKDQGDILKSCWPEYPEIISRWNEGTVLFDAEGMLVVFSPYELGPYSMGKVELRITYEEMSPLVGEGGLRRLGVQQGPDSGGKEQAASLTPAPNQQAGNRQ